MRHGWFREGSATSKTTMNGTEVATLNALLNVALSMGKGTLYDLCVLKSYKMVTRIMARDVRYQDREEGR